MGRRRNQQRKRKVYNLPVDKLFSKSNEPIEIPSSPSVQKLRSPRNHSPRNSPRHSAPTEDQSHSSEISISKESAEIETTPTEVTIENQNVTVELELKHFDSFDHNSVEAVESDSSAEEKEADKSSPLNQPNSTVQEQQSDSPNTDHIAAENIVQVMETPIEIHNTNNEQLVVQNEESSTVEVTKYEEILIIQNEESITTEEVTEVSHDVSQTEETIYESTQDSLTQDIDTIPITNEQIVVAETITEEVGLSTEDTLPVNKNSESTVTICENDIKVSEKEESILPSISLSTEEKTTESEKALVHSSQDVKTKQDEDLQSIIAINEKHSMELRLSERKRPIEEKVSLIASIWSGIQTWIQVLSA